MPAPLVNLDPASHLSSEAQQDSAAPTCAELSLSLHLGVPPGTFSYTELLISFDSTQVHSYVFKWKGCRDLKALPASCRQTVTLSFPCNNVQLTSFRDGGVLYFLRSAVPVKCGIYFHLRSWRVSTSVQIRPFSLDNCVPVIMAGSYRSWYFNRVSEVCNFFPHPYHWGQSHLQSLFVLFFMLKAKACNCFWPRPALTFRNHETGYGSPAANSGRTKGIEGGGF